MRLIQTLFSLAIIILPGEHVTRVDGYQTYASTVPNGDRIPNPCNPSEMWLGLGHQDLQGSGPRNRFGLDYANNNRIWNSALCQLDSDGDGQSNGAELGDPDCVWTPGSQPARTTSLSHPGVCEPITSSKCQGINSWLSCAAYKCPSFNLTTTQTVSLVFPNTSKVPAQDAAYICKGFHLPSELSYHLVGTTPNIDKPGVIQQMILFGCDKPVSSTLLSLSQPCSMGVTNCRTPIAIWDAGSAGQCHDENFGFPIGINGYQYAVLQLHWKNPTRSTTLFEHSGINLFYTSVLRPNAGQIVMVGQQDLVIPPNVASYSTTGSCVKGCTQFFPSSLYIAEAFLHMHQQGKSGSVDVIKDGVITNLITDNNYNYNVPQLLTLDSDIELRTGDELRVSCNFQTLNKNVTTIYGNAAADEMCFGFVTVYPAIKGFDRCSQWRELPLCPLSPALTYSNCNLISFPTYFDPILQYCNSSCTDVCKTLIGGMMATQCLNGNQGAWFVAFQPTTYPNLPSILNLTQACQSLTSTTPVPMTNVTVASGSSSTKYVVGFQNGVPNRSLILSIIFIGSALLLNK